MRTILVSNRLPITISRDASGLRVQRSSGGLASALGNCAELEGAVWVGWPGEAMDEEAFARVESRFTDIGTVPVQLAEHEVTGFYEHFSNGVIWPLFHYLPGQLPLRVEGWRDYVTVNERFADVVARHAGPNDQIWVHDYQLLLLPALLRRRLPKARIGFFLHIPFPGAEIYSVVPHREALLEGMLGADVVGFHTHRYRQHFNVAVKRLLGMNALDDEMAVNGRHVQLGVFPVSIDAQGYQQRAQTPAVAQEVVKLRGNGDVKLVVGVDRLDYTKGIPRRLLAFEQLLVQAPEWRGKVRFVQVAVPSREHVGAYRRFRREVNTLVGEINGRFGTPHWTPVHYLHRSIPETQLLALYRAADVMLVTPIRDGMNLVAKEFVATRTDEDGVLVLSEFAGAAAELTTAVIVNPFDVERTASQLDGALRMSHSDRARRMRYLREQVFGYDVDRWAREFLAALAGRA